MRLRELLAVAASLTMAQQAEAQPTIITDSGDTAWMLAASVLTLVAALPGLALVHGRGRAGPAGLALFLSTAIATLIFVAIGYSLAFSQGSTLLGSANAAMLRDLPALQPDTMISGVTHALYELIAALFAVGILVASVAERARVAWLGAMAGFWLLLVYVPVAHWIWGGGWLAQLGALDFGGGIVVQTTAGVASLTVAILLGRTRERDVAHDSRLAVAGTMLLYVGWFGLLGGAALGATDDAGAAILNAQLAASAAVLVGAAIERFRTGIVSVYGITAAAVAGLAAISTGAAYVGPAGAMLLGLCGALGAWAAAALAQQMKLGGAASAFVSHGGGAIAGAIAFPIFVMPVFGGPGFDEGITLPAQLGAQAVAVIAVTLWAAVVSVIVTFMVGAIFPLKHLAT